MIPRGYRNLKKKKKEEEEEEEEGRTTVKGEEKTET